MFFSDTKQKGEPTPRVKAIMDLGVVVGHEDEWTGTPGVDRTQWKLLDTVAGVNLSSFITPAMWVEIAQREGSAYIGGCCGNMSQLQDLINGIFRDGGWCEGHDLLEIGRICRGHDGFDEFDPMDDETFDKWISVWRNHIGNSRTGELDPWKVMGIVYNAVEPHLKPNSMKVPHNGGYIKQKSEEEYIVGVLHDTLSRLHWADLFARHDDEEDKPQHEANRKVLKAKLLPVLRQLADLLEESGVELDGFALVDPAKREVLSDHHGLCLYTTRADAERVQALWARWADEERERRQKNPDRYKPDDPNFWDARKSEIVRATVTAEEGLLIENADA